jgi:hypothetical protein
LHLPISDDETIGGEQGGSKPYYSDGFISVDDDMRYSLVESQYG